LKVEIRSPSEFAKAIRIARANLLDGTLDQLPTRDIGATPILSLAESGPWDDILLYEFRCRSCGAQFRLSAETYHGQGGSWMPIEPSSG